MNNGQSDYTSSDSSSLLGNTHGESNIHDEADAPSTKPIHAAGVPVGVVQKDNTDTSTTRTNVKAQEQHDGSNNMKKSHSAPGYKYMAQSNHDQESMLDQYPPKSTHSVAATNASASNALNRKQTQRTLSCDEAMMSRNHGQSNTHRHHHQRVYSHHSTSPILPSTPEFGPSSHVPDRLPPQDLLMHPLTDHGFKKDYKNNTIQSSDTAKDTCTLNKTDGSSIQQNTKHSHHSNNSGMVGNQYTSHFSSLGLDDFHHKPLQPGYRTFSFDGKMFRNASSQNPPVPTHQPPNTLIGQYDAPYHTLHDEYIYDNDVGQPLRLRSNSFRGQFPRHYDHEYLQPMVKQKYSAHAKASQDPHNNDEMQGLLSSSSPSIQQRQYHSEEDFYDPDTNRVNNRPMHQGNESNKSSNESKGGKF